MSFVLVVCRVLLSALCTWRKGGEVQSVRDFFLGQFTTIKYIGWTVSVHIHKQTIVLCPEFTALHHCRKANSFFFLSERFIFRCVIRIRCYKRNTNDAFRGLEPVWFEVAAVDITCRQISSFDCHDQRDDSLNSYLMMFFSPGFCKISTTFQAVKIIIINLVQPLKT